LEENLHALVDVKTELSVLLDLEREHSVGENRIVRDRTDSASTSLNDSVYVEVRKISGRRMVEIVENCT
jgi:hypothetical protein